MSGELIGLAFGAGMVAAFNPCGFAMLPAYLTLVVQGEESQGGESQDGESRHDQFRAVRRALAATAAMALGFLTVFGLFGLLTVSLASTVQRYLPYVTLAVGISLVALGVWLLSGRELMIRSAARGAVWTPTARLGSMYGYGIGYAIASLSCTVGPFLAVTASSLRTGSALDGVGVYAAYAAGLALVVGVLAVAVAVASSAVIDRMRRLLPYVNRIGGAVMVVVGLYVAWYGWFEVRLFSATGAGGDPVISAAGRVQRVLAGWVYQHGAWPWLLALCAVIACAGWGWVRTRRAPGADRGGSSRQ